MSLYFTNTLFRQREVKAVEGKELPNLAAVATVLRQTWTEIARDEGCDECDAFTALATDWDGELVTSATLTPVVSPRGDRS